MKNWLEFTDFLIYKESSEESNALDQPHVIKADPPMALPRGIKRLGEAFAKAKEVPIGKEVDPKGGGEKNVTLKTRKLYIVGSAVAAYLMKRTPKSYEIVSDAHWSEILKILKAAKPEIPVKRIDKKNGTVTIELDGATYKIETLRTGKNNPESGAPTYTTDLQQDARRRGLSIHALYYEINTDKILDYGGGIHDLKTGKVKLQNKEVSGDTAFDYLHHLSVSDSKHDEKDEEPIKNWLSKNNDELPVAKVRGHFWDTMRHLHSNPKKVIEHYQRLGLLEKIFPDLKINPELPDKDICTTCKSKTMIMANLLKDNDVRKVQGNLKSAGYSDTDIRPVVLLLKLLQFKPEHYYEFKRELLNTGLSKRQLIDWAKANNLNRNLLEKLYDSRLEVNQDELKQHGFKGRTLSSLTKDLETRKFMRSV